MRRPLLFAALATLTCCALTTSFDGYDVSVHEDAADDVPVTHDGPIGDDAGVDTKQDVVDAGDSAASCDEVTSVVYPCPTHCPGTACCLPPSPATGLCSSTCNNGLSITCLATIDCDGGVCCLDQQFNGGKGRTICAATCSTPLVRLCAAAGECGAGNGCKSKRLPNDELVGECEACP